MQVLLVLQEIYPTHPISMIFAWHVRKELHPFSGCQQSSYHPSSIITFTFYLWSMTCGLPNLRVHFLNNKVMAPQLLDPSRGHMHSTLRVTKIPMMRNSCKALTMSLQTSILATQQWTFCNTWKHWRSMASFICPPQCTLIVDFMWRRLVCRRALHLHFTVVFLKLTWRVDVQRQERRGKGKTRHELMMKKTFMLTDALKWLECASHSLCIHLLTLHFLYSIIVWPQLLVVASNTHWLWSPLLSLFYRILTLLSWLRFISLSHIESWWLLFPYCL